jgi:hypothetical protein
MTSQQDGCTLMAISSGWFLKAWQLQTTIRGSGNTSDEGDEVSGNGWVKLRGNELRGEIRFHLGDKSWFRARRVE